MNISSDNILIYPVGDRTQDSGYSDNGYIGKLNLEQNIVNQRANLVDNTDYFISSSSNISDVNISNGKLIINAGKLFIGGYSITLTKPITVNLSNYSSLTNYWVYFVINLYDINIKNGEDIISTKVLSGDDLDNRFTGLSLELSQTYPIDDLESGIYYLILGTVYYNNGWNLFKNLNMTNKLIANNMTLDDKSFEEHLNDFILDDGEITEPEPEE